MSAAFDLVIFDMDDVLGHLDRQTRLSLLSAATGKSAEFLHERIWASDFEPAAECGAYATGDEYLAELNRRIDSQLTRAEWIHARRAATTLNRSVLTIAATVSDQCEIAMLTNNGALLRESLGEILPEVESLFGSRAHASFEFKARKPTPLVFQRLLARYRVPAQRAIFIDDYIEFVDGARNVGLNAIHFAHADQLGHELRAYGFACEN
jgi:HAD superfamily hydrolase (TIGR01509 family)